MLRSSYPFVLMPIFAAILLLGSAFHIIPALTFTLLGLIAYARLWQKAGSQHSWTHSKSHDSRHTWIMVACRNESVNIPVFFAHLRALSTPIAGLIWVDDHSTDDSVKLVDQEAKSCPFPVQLLRLPKDAQGKKAALNLGRCHLPTEAEWVWFTDADCRVQPHSLSCLLQAAPAGGVALGSLLFEGGTGLISEYQKMENSALLSLTEWGLSQGHLLMANGGNLLVHASLLQPLNGENSSSGDDIFALEPSYLRNPELFGFASCPNAAVRTSVESRLGDFIQQRLRWMRKTPLQQDKSSLALQITIGLFAFSPIFLLLLGLFFAPYESTGYALLATSLWLGKAVIDLGLLAPALRKKGQSISRAGWLSVAQTLWLPLLGLLALWPSHFSWKGRRFYR
jgi:hypothetical protein